MHNKKAKEIILGIDPGFGRMGFGVIEKKGQDWKVLSYGCVVTSVKLSFVDRLKELSSDLKKIIKKYHPDCVAVEDLFFYKNLKTAIKVGEARGVILLTLCQANIPIEEFTPLQVKQALTGYGRAEKSQVQKMVGMLFKINKKNIQDDAADALAIALTCAYSLKLKKLIKK